MPKNGTTEETALRPIPYGREEARQEAQSRFLHAIKLGLKRGPAANYARLGLSTLNGWLDPKHPRYDAVFTTNLLFEEALVEGSLTQTLLKICGNDNHRRQLDAIKYYLEHRFPESWGTEEAPAKLREKLKEFGAGISSLTDEELLAQLEAGQDAAAPRE